MLGSGRPFVLEVVSPKRVFGTICFETLAFLEQEINKCTYTNVANLQFKDCRCFSKLKEWEAEKLKIYVCVVKCKHNIDENKLKQVNNIKDVQITQKTPIRVLHRRTLSQNTRFIHRI